jgi:cytochrome c553
MEASMILALHKWSAILFVCLYIFKLAGLIGVDTIKSFFGLKPLRILEMVVSVAFLVTGVWRYVSIPAQSHTLLLHLKIALVFINIPLAIVAYKRNIKWLGVVSLVLLLGAYGLAEVNRNRPMVSKAVKTSTDGAAIYTMSNCAGCHGLDGKAGIAGAKDLTQSSLSDADMQAMIAKGNAKGMPPYKKQLTPEQITAVATYVKSLKK